jgi:excisionase family DNA binding protein
VNFDLHLGDDQLAELAERVAEILGVDTSRDRDPWPEWMSITTAARYLDVPVERLRKLKDRGQIPFAQEACGYRVFFRRSDLDAWMGTYRHAPTGGGA